MFGYPTREELDDVHRTVTDLRRELRALQRANRDKQAVPAKPAAHAWDQYDPTRNTPS